MAYLCNSAFNKKDRICQVKHWKIFDKQKKMTLSLALLQKKTEYNPI